MMRSEGINVYDCNEVRASRFNGALCEKRLKGHCCNNESLFRDQKTSYYRKKHAV